MSLPEPPRLHAAEQLALRLEREIIEGALGPGDRLGTKAEIGARFGYSNGTVNEALLLLETRGVLHARPGPGGGIFATSPASHIYMERMLRTLAVDDPDLAECRAVRRVLEPALCFEAARRCDRADAAALRRILARMRRSQGDPAALARLGASLHRRIAEISANSLLRTFYAAVLQMLAEGAAPGAPEPEPAAAVTLAAHEELVEALLGGHPGRLARAVEVHAGRCALGT